MENEQPPAIVNQGASTRPVSALPYFHEPGSVADALLPIAACGVLISGGLSVVAASAQSFVVLSIAASYRRYPGLMSRVLSLEVASVIVGFTALAGGISCLRRGPSARRLLVVVEMSRLALTLVSLLVSLPVYFGQPTPAGYPRWYVFLHPLSLTAQAALLHGLLLAMLIYAGRRRE